LGPNFSETAPRSGRIEAYSVCINVAPLDDRSRSAGCIDIERPAILSIRPTLSGPSLKLRNELDETVDARIAALCAEGWALWDKFDQEVRSRHFHPFVGADYEVVADVLRRYRRPGQRFLEWGAATGVITIMADLLGFDAYGIELDPQLVAMARTLAAKFDSRARFVAGSFMPSGYEWRSSGGDNRIGTLGVGPSAYRELGYGLDDFGIVWGYPWDGEQELMLDLMSRYGNSDAILLLNHVTDGVVAYRGGRKIESLPAPRLSP
jgi:hypothetical protein